MPSESSSFRSIAARRSSGVCAVPGGRFVPAPLGVEPVEETEPVGVVEPVGEAPVGEPGIPRGTLVPEVPVVPALPVEREVPGLPAVPGLSGVLAFPGTPGLLPGAPGTPGTPGTPGLPGAPDDAQPPTTSITATSTATAERGEARDGRMFGVLSGRRRLLWSPSRWPSLACRCSR